MGTSATTPSVSFTDTLSIMAMAPMIISPLRSTIDMVTPAMLSTMAMSVVIRERTSPVRTCMNQAWSRVRTWL